MRACVCVFMLCVVVLSLSAVDDVGTLSPPGVSNLRTGRCALLRLPRCPLTTPWVHMQSSDHYLRHSQPGPCPPKCSPVWQRVGPSLLISPATSYGFLSYPLPHPPLLPTPTPISSQPPPPPTQLSAPHPPGSRGCLKSFTSCKKNKKKNRSVYI